MRGTDDIGVEFDDICTASAISAQARGMITSCMHVSLQRKAAHVKETFCSWIKLLLDILHLSFALVVQVKNPWKNIFSRKYRPELVMATFIPFFQQFTGPCLLLIHTPQKLLISIKRAQWLPSQLTV